MFHYMKDIILIGILWWSALSWSFLKKQKKKLLNEHINMVFYTISSISVALLILFYYFVEQYAPEYIDPLFYWLWIPALCLCFLLLLEARFHLRSRIWYALSFWKKGTRMATLAVGACIGIVAVIWYGGRLNQMFFRPWQYQLAEEHEWKQANWQQNDTPHLDLALMVDGAYVMWYNTRKEHITPFSRKKLYIEFRSTEPWRGDDLHLELFHHGKWYRLKEAESAKQKLSEKQWVTPSTEEYDTIDLEALQGVIPGYYRLCMSVWEEDTKEDTEENGNYISTSFWIK